MSGSRNSGTDQIGITRIKLLNILSEASERLSIKGPGIVRPRFEDP